MVPRTEAALPRCKATETYFRMKERDCASLDTALTRLPMSAKKSRVSVPMAPAVSNTPATKWCVCAKSWYLVFFFSSANTTTALASLVACATCDAAKVSVHVASQTRVRPVFQGMIVTTSGLLPSDLQSPEGSNTEGICAAAKERLMMLLITA